MSQIKPFVSVIVPIFNTENYVKRCLQSIMEGTLKNIEIICVDDASTDRSAEIVAGFIEHDRRVKLVRHPRNLGLGGARNTGIAEAQADYVGGVDSDDWVAPTMYERLFKATDDGRADVVECGYLQIGSDGQVISSYEPKPLQLKNDDNQINVFEVTRPSFCTKLWRRTLFTENDIWFPEMILFEDLATTPRLLAKAKDIRFIEDSSYNYFKRQGSITFSASERHQMDHFRCFDILLEFLLKNNLFERYRIEFELQMCHRLSYHGKNVLNSDLSESEKARYVRHLLMMIRGYRESYTELYGASSARLLALMDVKEISEKERERVRLAEKIACLEAEIAKERGRHQALLDPPAWKMLAPVRKLFFAAKRAAKQFASSLDR